MVAAAATAERRWSGGGDLGPVGGRCQVVTRAGSEWPAGVGGDEQPGSVQALLMNLSKLWEIVKDREAWWAAVHGVIENLTKLRDCCCCC